MRLEFYNEAVNAVRRSAFDVQTKVLGRAWQSATKESIPAYLDTGLFRNPRACFEYVSEHREDADVPILLNAASARVRSAALRRRLGVALAVHGGEASYPLAESLWSSPVADDGAASTHILDRTSLPEVGLLYQESPDALERHQREWSVFQYGSLLSPLGVSLPLQKGDQQKFSGEAIAQPNVHVASPPNLGHVARNKESCCFVA